ncbi:MAG: hypothetical protein ABWY30_03045 [Microterricola sp.]
MKALHERMAVTLTVAFVVYALVLQTPPDAALLTTAVMLAAAFTLGARYLAVGIAAGELHVGARSRAHSEVLSRAIEPQHPNTVGRPRTRAPARAEATA